MKLIIAFVRPFTIDKIVVALEDIEKFPGITVTDARGFGQRLQTAAYDSLNPFEEKKRIEIACSDEMVEQIVAAIRAQEHTGKKGDGIIVVLPIGNVIRI